MELVNITTAEDYREGEDRPMTRFLCRYKLVSKQASKDHRHHLPDDHGYLSLVLSSHRIYKYKKGVDMGVD